MCRSSQRSGRAHVYAQISPHAPRSCPPCALHARLRTRPYTCLHTRLVAQALVDRGFKAEEEVVAAKDRLEQLNEQIEEKDADVQVHDRPAQPSSELFF